MRSLELALAGAHRIVFLCSGNMIRSAFAELYARHLDCPRPVLSGATTYRNQAIHPEAARALAARGVDPRWIAGFRPTTWEQVLPELRTDAVVFGMTRDHLAALPGGLRGRGFLLPSVLGSPAEIPDPLFEGGFDEVFALLERCVRALVERLDGVQAP